ncbi:uncharacterized protein G2W53_006475 [Senna tora]|uniref:Uncharacterized protein n=1 Tax=Senna tora TaxID=362788 RepID=A0A834X498_9FABA|nr:uncharacterized protein G2W53_006475 [Senna tora]
MGDEAQKKTKYWKPTAGHQSRTVAVIVQDNKGVDQPKAM